MTMFIQYELQAVGVSVTVYANSLKRPVEDAIQKSASGQQRPG